MPTPNEIRKLSIAKARRLEKLIDAIEIRIDKSSKSLTKVMLKEFAQRLKIEKGRIVGQLTQETITLFNQAYQTYLQQHKRDLIKTILDDIQKLIADNFEFYKKTIPDFGLDQDDIKRIVDRRLGIKEDGTLVRRGYMDGLLDDAPIRAEVQRYVFKEIFKSSGFEAFRRGLKEFIEGKPDKFGAFQRYYKTFSFDAYAQLNSFTSGVYAQKLGLTFFIYNGGLIETSRDFCRARNGQVFSTEEADKWKDDPNLKAIDSRETYNWLVDRGGYNCRHAIDFIADEIAFELRPELKES